MQQRAAPDGRRSHYGVLQQEDKADGRVRVRVWAPKPNTLEGEEWRDVEIEKYDVKV